MSEGGTIDGINGRVERTDCENGWFSWMRWKPTSPNMLIRAEERMLSIVKTVYEKKFVNLSSGNKIWTLMFNREIKKKTPLVMIHGMAGGVGLWALNYDSITGKRPVYAFDLLGFARSSHPTFSNDAMEVEHKFMESIEEWREAVGLDKMILMGHSFGAFLASSYALKYPERVKHLILADPWGFPEWKEDPERMRRIPWLARGAIKILSPFNPLAAVRGAGPLGPRLVRLRGDLGQKFVDVEDGDDSPAIFDYIYHCNAQPPSGESGFKNLTIKIGFAKNPMIARIGNLQQGIPVSFIYGARTWMDKNCGKEAQELLPNNNVQVYSIKAAGHHIYADQPENFHQIINSICEDLD